MKTKAQKLCAVIDAARHLLDVIENAIADPPDEDELGIKHLSLPAEAPETYEELARLYVPRKIHDKIGQQNATEIVDWLAVRARTADQVEFLDLFSDLLDEYESQFLKDPGPDDPLELLKHLVEENGISTRKLGKVLNVDHSVAARILKGERTITIEHAKHLGERFKVNPQVFLKLK